MSNTKEATNARLDELFKNGSNANNGLQVERRAKTRLYFAYGSNLNMRQMKTRCPDAIPMFKATLYNAKIEFKTYADVINEDKKRSYVKGAVYEVTKECIKSLDKYEGFPRLYKKVKCIVEGPFNKYHEAFMYVMQPNVRELNLPTQNYLDAISEGYFDWNMSTLSLSRAWEHTAIKLGEIEAFDSELRRLI